MNELRKKLSEILPSGPKRSGGTSGFKVPAFASDIYWDLRQRHLLPFAVLLVVAVAAVPFVLGDSGESEEAPPPPPIASTSAANAREVVVTETQQGLRSYRKRLRNRQPTNPFKPQYTGAPAADADQSESPTLEEAPVEATAPEEPIGGTTGEAPTSGGGAGDVPSGQPSGEIRYFTYAIDVRIVPVSSNGVPSKAEPIVRRDLPELTMLPARKVPALVFMQPSADEEKALMLVNPNVKGLFGEGVCVSGGETCQLLALKKGLPQTVVYGGNERIFRIELLDIKLVETDRLKKAPLGSEKDG